jgi:hypothetical protein
LGRRDRDPGEANKQRCKKRSVQFLHVTVSC